MAFIRVKLSTIQQGVQIVSTIVYLKTPLHEFLKNFNDALYRIKEQNRNKSLHKNIGVVCASVAEQFKSRRPEQVELREYSNQTKPSRGVSVKHN